MRARTIALIVFVLLVAAFVALNIDEFTRVSVLSLGFTSVSVPLGMVMLLLLAIATAVFSGLTVYIQSMNLIETRQYARQLSAQRDLADKAEASRFTELRSFLEAQAAAEQRREAAADTVLSERFAEQNRLVMTRLEQTDNALAAYMGQLEDRLERRGPSAPSGLVGPRGDLHKVMP
jgi:biopolymer transport protein ExbB/TolQ